MWKYKIENIYTCQIDNFSRIKIRFSECNIFCRTCHRTTAIYLQCWVGKNLTTYQTCPSSLFSIYPFVIVKNVEKKMLKTIRKGLNHDCFWFRWLIERPQEQRNGWNPITGWNILFGAFVVQIDVGIYIQIWTLAYKNLKREIIDYPTIK